MEYKTNTQTHEYEHENKHVFTNIQKSVIKI